MVAFRNPPRTSPWLPTQNQVMSMTVKGAFLHSLSCSDCWDVVGLGRGGQQLGGDGGVHHDGGFHEGIREVGDVGGPS